MNEHLSPETIAALQSEVALARIKFPKPDGLVPALCEEVGEWAGETDPAKRRRELLQVACVALRLFEEGDPLEGTPEVILLKQLAARLGSHSRHVLRTLFGEEATAKS